MQYDIRPVLKIELQSMPVAQEPSNGLTKRGSTVILTMRTNSYSKVKSNIV